MNGEDVEESDDESNDKGHNNAGGTGVIGMSTRALRAKGLLGTKDKQEEEPEEVEIPPDIIPEWPEIKEAFDKKVLELNIDKSDDKEEDEIDPSLFFCHSAKRLQLKMAKGVLTNLPYGLGNLRHLLTLILSDNSLVTLPPSIGLLHSLKALEIQNNELIELPVEINQLEKLEVLLVSDNKLKSLQISNLPNLTSLHADRNELESLDINFLNSPRLRDLTASSNKIMIIPDSIGTLKLLETVDLNDNQINGIPQSLAECKKKLKHFICDSNPIKDPKMKKLLIKAHEGSEGRGLKEFIAYVGKAGLKNK